MLLYSGHEEENASHTHGVALMQSKEACNAFKGWESHGPRIIKASFETKRQESTMNVIQFYAPTNNSNEDDRTQFNKSLRLIVAECTGNDLTILIGDLNAKVRMENTMRRHGLGERNENGERFANIFALNRLDISGKIFPHKRIHKATWV
ncbi:unnamed protein product [Schistosoma mattheei]|uniref:Uncharacterized protein n=1 Tax=Schistosoma mattheei TaxID=31246 RepID=A0A183NXJ9_9TREM|nr:unnamed protein product [Schistosoma mattheei]